MFHANHWKAWPAVGAALMTLSAAHAQLCAPNWDVALGRDGTDGQIYSLYNYNGELHAGGKFSNAGSNEAFNIAVWRSGNWRSLRNGVLGGVFAMAEFQGNLYVGGYFSEANHRPSEGLAYWDGADWHAMPDKGMRGNVNALMVWDDGTGPALYVGGGFDKAGDMRADGIAKWDGAAWSTLHGGVSLGRDDDPGAVYSMAVYDGKLIVGGSFRKAGNMTVNRIAAWDGSNWESLGGGVDRGGEASRSVIHALEVFNGKLYAGGNFKKMDGVSANGLAVYDGSTWEAVRSGVGGGRIMDLEVYDDGAGESLYLIGTFTRINRGSGKYIGRLTANHDYLPVGTGLSNWGFALRRAADDGSLHAGGTFREVSGDVANHVASYLGCVDGLCEDILEFKGKCGLRKTGTYTVKGIVDTDLPEGSFGMASLSTGEQAILLIGASGRGKVKFKKLEKPGDYIITLDECPDLSATATCK